MILFFTMASAGNRVRGSDCKWLSALKPMRGLAAITDIDLAVFQVEQTEGKEERFSKLPNNTQARKMKSLNTYHMDYNAFLQCQYFHC